MHAEVIAIGDELTSGERLDTNSQWLSQRPGPGSVAGRTSFTFLLASQQFPHARLRIPALVDDSEHLR